MNIKILIDLDIDQFHMAKLSYIENINISSLLF